MPKCPKCLQEFDGWDCKCGYALSIKARKMHPKFLTEEEAKKIRKELGLCH